MTIFAKAGEWVTCENGHRICQIARDLIKNEMMDPPRDFANWQQSEPALGTPADAILCADCGAHWFNNGQILDQISINEEAGTKLALVDGPRLHFEDGWR